MERRFDQATIIESPISLSLSNLSPIKRKEKIKSNNILVYWENLNQGDFLSSNDPQLTDFISKYQKLGFAAFGDMLILHVIAHQMRKKGIQIPFGGECISGHQTEYVDASTRRKIGKERKSMFDELISNLKFKKENGAISIYEEVEGELINITSDIYQDAQVDVEKVEQLSTYDSYSGYTRQFVQNFMIENSGLLLFLRNTKSISNEPYVFVKTDNEQKQTHSIPDVVLSQNQDLANRSLRETISFSRVSQKRSELITALETGKIQTIPAFNKDNWPKHPILDQIKKQLGPIVESYISDNGILCDPLDLEYQALFRLTTYDLSEIFIGGADLIRYCIDAGAYDNWRKILTLDPSVISGFQLSSDLVSKALKEQSRIIQHRLVRSRLPVDQIVVPTGIFSESGWEIMKDGENDINAIQKDSNGTIVNSRRVQFKPVNPELASSIHNDLHYIHTPRTDMAFGFFLEDEQLPFTTLALGKIDRDYKQNTLLLFGYDPRHTIDFTRLYSRPGVPKNASSAIFGETFNYIRHNLPNIEAAMSAFMPSYASGLSMLTGGFEVPILAKPNIHYFYDAGIDGVPTMEHLTKRRQAMKGVNFISSTLPLLPTVELLSPIRKPRFEPVLQAGKDMVLIQ